MKKSIKLVQSSKNKLTISNCVICKNKFVGFGNNPRPLKERGRCCDDCNSLVIQARIERLKK